jgi:hypothetical protein
VVTISYETPGSTHRTHLCPVDAAYLYRGHAFGDDAEYIVVEVRRPNGSPVKPDEWYSDAELLCLTCGLPPWPLPGGEIAECACGVMDATTQIIVVDAVAGVLIAQEPPRGSAVPIHAAIHFPVGCTWVELHIDAAAALAAAIDHAETCPVASLIPRPLDLGGHR